MVQPTIGDFIVELHKFADSLSKLNVDNTILDDEALQQFVAIKATRMMIQGAISEVEKEKNEREANREAPEAPKAS